jgi:hypothetical protein
MTQLPFHTIPSCPDAPTATNTIARFIDGLGFRYHWATEGLTESEIAFRPHPSSMNVIELLTHIYDLAHTINRVFGGSAESERPTSYLELRISTLNLFAQASERLKVLDDARLVDFNLNGGSGANRNPFWFYLNGPIADALTHVGQITSWRRIAGNPQAKGVNVFLGTYTKLAQ